MLAAVVVMHATACATPGYYVIPSVTIGEVYDDNLFYTSEDEQADFITRISPALEVGHEAENLSWSGRYRFDAEAYARESRLNSAMVRQFADVEVEYLPTDRLTLSAAADYTETDTPLDLGIVPGGTLPGLLVGRVEANRTSVRSAASYRLTPRTTGSMAFSLANEELEDIAESDTTALEAWFDQRLSELTTLSYGYIHRRYEFDGNGLDGDAGHSATSGEQDSDTPWVGLSHQFNARTRVVVRAGPRLDGGSVDPYAQVALEHAFTGGEVLLEYQRDETTLLGEPRKLELESLSATISRRFGTRLDVQFTPGYAKASRADSSVDIYSAGIGAVYKINEVVSLTASYDFNLQKVGVELGGIREVTSNVIQVGVRFTYPRRELREPR